MKTAISLPDPIFQEAERFARRAGKSRSRLYGEALAEYLERHSSDAITETLDRVCAGLDPADPFAVAASRRVLQNTEW